MFMETIRTLNMKFRTDLGKTHTISIAHCKEQPSEGEVRAAMQEIIDNGLLVMTLESIVGAQVVAREVSEIF